MAIEPRYTLTNYGWSCGDCGALVVTTPVHDKWHHKLEHHTHVQSPSAVHTGKPMTS